MMDGFNNTAMFDPVNACNPAAVGDVPLQWLQTPPVQLPWVLPTNQYPDIVQFSAQQPVMPDGYAAGSYPFHPSSHPNAKRKSDWTEEVPCPKKLITEEKISGLLKEMHITKSAALDQGNGNTIVTGITNEADVPAECPKQQLKRLVLCEEIRQFKNDPILPSSLLSKLSGASMSLVLWKPPAGHLGEMLKQAAQGSVTSMETEAEDDQPRASTSKMQ